ncbi:uncharacterized protein TRIADDRAFT_52329 [Trichoplax adhaerens]|uniref:MYCBP-associated protein n=1 Tax=Trichoplax adhaerens TaxID=10228 RepID=B3RHZ7_TRIAD|nr:hypothetical protein TRIADDRAFT_52329 [Trichoplax adhaerens]EDV29676.1 hypothetical protein TRIADDRAFT_52329 [Trichoplax adhaerens]|eukprot:XP_002108878.1 hypothetical protein TRIADDRAFT_52329 [Trichoplax adhaerens]
MPSVKPNKKERPKSTDKMKSRPKRDLTPDKVATPPDSTGQGAPTNNSTLTEDKPLPQFSTTSYSNNNQKIGHNTVNSLDPLIIKDEDLFKIHQPKEDKSATSKPTVTYKIRKQPADNVITNTGVDTKTKCIYVAKVTASEATESAVMLSMDASKEPLHSGPRLDRKGQLIPHSILGSISDFNSTSLKKQQQPLKSPEVYDLIIESPVQHTSDSDTAGNNNITMSKSANEEAALDNWKRHMRYRKSQQQYLSKILETNPAMLVMNQSEDYRKNQEEREIIDLAIPTMDKGKGYRVGSEFWMQPDRLGNEDNGISLTLGKSQRGQRVPVEHIDKHPLIKEEMGINFRSSSTVHYPWDKSLYLQNRKKELEESMKLIDPHKPDISSLAVIGRSKLWEDGREQSDINTSLYNDDSLSEADSEINDPFKQHADCVPQPILGPCITVAGQTVRWEGENCGLESDVAIITRVLFETYAGKVSTTTLDIENLGTSTIYFSWTNLPSDKSLDSILYGKAQRFYFNTGVDMIMPGQKMKFPFTFKSSNPGIFTETWCMNTKPTLCGGAAIKVVLRGVALEEDINKDKRSKIEAELRRKQALYAVNQLLDDIIEDVKTPPRSLSPVDAHITPEELFERRNPGLYYRPDGINELKMIWYHIHQPIPPEYLENTEDVKIEKGSKQDKSGKSDRYDKMSKSDKQDKQDKNFRGAKNDLADRQNDYFEPPEPDVPWDWSIDMLEEKILTLEDDSWKNDCLQRMNNAINMLSFPILTPLKQQMYSVGYSLLINLMDSIANYGVTLRSILGLPEKESLEEEDAATTTKKKMTASETTRSESTKKSESRSKKPNKKDDKDFDSLRPQSRTIRTSKSKHRDRLKSTTTSSQEYHDQTRASTPVDKTDPTIELKYKEKLYSQVYNMMEATIDKMVYLFDDIKAKNGSNIDHGDD